MKEIKAYIKISVLQEVVAELIQAGFCCMTIIEVSGLGDLIDPRDWKYSLEFVEKTSKVAKLELVCNNKDAPRAVEVIKKYARTHEKGDGIICVSPVERAVKIRTGEEGEEVLQK